MLEYDTSQAWSVVEKLGDALRVIHADKASAFGKILHLAHGGRARPDSCEQIVLDRALRELSPATRGICSAEPVGRSVTWAGRHRAATLGPQPDPQ